MRSPLKAVALGLGRLRACRDPIALLGASRPLNNMMKID